MRVTASLVSELRYFCLRFTVFRSKQCMFQTHLPKRVLHDDWPEIEFVVSWIMRVKKKCNHRHGKDYQKSSALKLLPDRCHNKVHAGILNIWAFQRLDFRTFRRLDVRKWQISQHGLCRQVSAESAHKVHAASFAIFERLNFWTFESSNVGMLECPKSPTWTL